MFKLGLYTHSDPTVRDILAMASSSSGATFTVESYIRGYHIYKDIWDTTIAEELRCARESDSSNDCYAVAVRKKVCALFLECNGAITCTITGPRR